MRSHAHWILVALCLGSASTHAETLSVTAAWDGWSRPGRVTELELRIGDAVPGDYDIEIRGDGEHVIGSQITAVAGQESVLRLPVASGEDFDVTVRSADRGTVQAGVRLSLSESPLLGWAARPADEPAPDFHRVFVGAAALPRHAAAYSSIDALVIDADTLARLDDRQLAALSSHVAGCGATVLVEASKAAANMLRNSAGCGGARLSLVPTTDAASAALAAMMSAAYDGPDAARGLRAASRPDFSLWRKVVLLGCGYAAAAMVVLALKPTLAALLVPTLLVTTLALLLGRTLDSTGSLLVWSEAQQGDRIAIHASRQLETGTGRGDTDVPVLALLGNPSFCQGERASRWNFDAKESRYQSVRFEQRLFDNVSLCYAGHFPISRSARVEFDPDGAASIRNTGAGAWPQAWFASGGSVAALPAVEAGRSVVAGGGGDPSLPDSINRALLGRTPSGGTALLWPLDLSAVGDSLIHAEGWLLLRVPAGGST